MTPAPRPHILIVDDDTAVCDTLEAVLGRYYHVHTCRRISEAKQVLRTVLPDLLIVDYQVGKDSGVGFYKAHFIKAKHPVPAILISAFLISQTQSAATMKKIRSLFVEVVEKPIELFPFVERIRSILPV